MFIFARRRGERMRLTLRTMLAYMDDILDPADAEELASKIKESEFASRLVHRIRSSMRHLRVGAPKLNGKGMALDPNTVAEYLDNALPHERFPDFEKVCLESDVHLGEVAACHQILTLVLGERADVPDTIRDRVYLLGNQTAGNQTAGNQTAGKKTAGKTMETSDGTHLRVDAQHARKAAMEPPQSEPQPAASSTPSDVEQERITEVPEYMKVAQRKSVWLYLVGAAAMLLVGVFVYQAFFNTGTAIVEKPGVVEPEPNGPRERNPTLGQRDSVVNPIPSEVDTPPIVPPADPNVGTTDQVDLPSIPAVDPSVHPIENGSNTPAVNSGNDVAPPPNEIPETNGATALPIESNPTPNSENPQPVNPVDGPGTAADTNNPNGEGTNGVVDPNELARIDVNPQPLVVMDVGKNASSDEQVLARWNPTEKTWLRVPPRAMLASTERFTVLPMYQPQIFLLTGIQLQFSGQSTVRLLPTDAQGVSGVSIESGRVLLDTGSADRIRLQLGKRSGVLVFGDVKSVAAIEVKKYLPPGTDARASKAMEIVMIYASNGSIQWQDSDESATVTVNSGELRYYVDDHNGQTISYGSGPKWISGLEASQIEKRAAKELEPHLTLDRSISLSLKERASDTKIEVRSLAARSLAHLGELGALIKELSDPNQHSFWSQDFGTLQIANSQGPENANRIFSLLERIDAQRGEELYKLITSYTEEELGSGGAGKLVGLLESEQLIERVLAIENLKQICEMELFYSAWRPEAMRRSKVQRWRERLEGGLIVYKRPPSPIPPVPVTAASSVAPDQPAGNVLP
ncbi:MAG: hypothetical protein ACI9G1_001014 [Pirellulaceae bacterium]